MICLEEIAVFCFFHKQRKEKGQSNNANNQRNFNAIQFGASVVK